MTAADVSTVPAPAPEHAGRPSPHGVAGHGEAADDPLAAELDVLAERIAPLFTRPEPRRQAMRYVAALLSRGETANSWQLAEQIGDDSPWRMQRLLTRAHWAADGIRDAVRDHLVDRLGQPGGVLLLGQSDLIKKGTKTVAVARQYTELTGRVENCQAAVLTAYSSARGQALLDRELYLPRAWSADLPRCRQAGVPEARTDYRSKPELGRAMLERAMQASVPFAWVCGGLCFGLDESLRRWLEGHKRKYVLQLPLGHVARTAGGGPLAALSAPVRPPVRTDDGVAPGEQWAYVRIPPGSTADAPPADGFAHTLLVRRRPDLPRPEHYVAHAPRDTAPEEMAAAALSLLDLRRSLTAARIHAGLHRHEVRTWTAWYRHTSLSLLALAARTGATARSLPLS